MKGLTREERHQWVGQPGHWVCKRCQARRTGGTLDDGLCAASLSGHLDYGPSELGRSMQRRAHTIAASLAAEAARPTRLDTPETVDKVPRQGGLGERFRSTGKGRLVSPEQEGKP